MDPEYSEAVAVFIQNFCSSSTSNTIISQPSSSITKSTTTMDTSTIIEVAASSSSSSACGDDIYSIQAKITTQQSLIKQMKKDSTAPATIQSEVEKLLSLRAQLAEIEKAALGNAPIFNRKGFDELILRKMYVVPSFEIHNGPAGLFDYGPPACALKSNVLALWRQHFVLEESMLEMECTNLTPSSVLETSGHVERFTDFMTRDAKTGECFRADKLLEDAIDKFIESSGSNMTTEEADQHRIIQRQADAFSATELDELLLRYGCHSPSDPTKQTPLTPCFPFNLMFRTTIGPEGTSVGFLRPETAQGLFVNFRRLLDYNQGRMPFAAAQIGLGFRNEIAPRNGLLRVREFCMAEIEHFVDPADKRHPRFNSIRHVVLTLFPAEAQLSTGRCVEMTAGEAVSTGVINNETLAYFMTRTQQWLTKIGVTRQCMRLRQHLKTEMAHYAADCWDMEIQMSYGWIECVGHADRACYDLEQHSKRCNVSMQASQRLAQPLNITRSIAVPNKKLLGPRFKTDQKLVMAALEVLDDETFTSFRSEIETKGESTVTATNGQTFTVTADLVTFETEDKTVYETKYTPSVIEPSYGVGRILYAVLEHSFSQRYGDEQRCVMAFKPCVAPIKLGIFPLTNNPSFIPIINKLRDTFQKAGLANKIDASTGTVGRRYSRADELGIPFGVTVDFQSLIDGTVTVRDRDSMAQVRVGGDRLLSLIQQLVNESISWSYVMERFLVVNTGGADAEDEEETDIADKEEKKATTTASATSSTAVVVAKTVVESSPRGRFSRPNPIAATATA